MELEGGGESRTRSRLLLWVLICVLLVVAIGSLLGILPWLPAEDEGDQLINRGMKEYADRDFESAEKTFKQVIELDPTRGKAYNYLGVMARDAKRLEEAECYFRKAVEVDPLTSANHFNLSLLYSTLERYDEAENEIREAIRLIAPKSQYLLLYAKIGQKRGLPPEEVARRLRLAVSTAADQVQTLKRHPELLAKDTSLLYAWSEAGKSLLRMNDTSGVKIAAQQYVNAQESHVREFVGKVLREMGGEEALKGLLDDQDPEVRRTAKAALERLTQTTAN